MTALRRNSLSGRVWKLVLIFLALYCMLASISAPVSAASLSKKKLTLYVGETYKLKTARFPASAKWTSSKKSVVSVSRGVIRAKKEGQAVIRALAKGKSASCTVTVKPVALSSKKLTVSRFDIAELSLPCSSPGKVRWSSSASQVAVVYGQNTDKVYVYGKKIGTAIVSATYMNRTYQCLIRVEEHPDLENLMTEADLAKKSPLYGKKIAVYGSSNEVGSHNSSNKSWVDYLTEKLKGTATVINKSKGGNNLINSVDRISADPDLDTYDIIIVSTVRNSFRGNLPLPSSSDPRGFLQSLYTLSGLIERGRQTVYLASCLPMEKNFRSFSNTMSIYDGLVYKTCRKLGFKYLDMHSWLGISDEEAGDQTSDGYHYLASAHPVLADHCLAALTIGGEALRSYQCKVTGDELLKVLALQSDMVGPDTDRAASSYYSVDTELNVSFYLWLEAKDNILDGTRILNASSGVNFYPASTCLYGTNEWGVCRMLTDGSVVKEHGTPEGTSFAIQINSRAMLDAGI